MKALTSLLAEISQASFPFEVHTLLEPALYESYEAHWTEVCRKAAISWTLTLR